MVRYCAVKGCFENNKTTKNRRFFRFPADELRCRQWIKLAGRMDLESKDIDTLHSSYFVCEGHFANSDRSKKYLKVDVLPMFLLPQRHQKFDSSKYTQTDYSSISKMSAEVPITSHASQSVQTIKELSENTELKKKSEVEFQSESKKRRLQSTNESVINVKKSNMSPLLKKMIDTHKALKHDGSEYLIFALNIYYASPLAYRFLSKILGLPNISSLRRRITIDISTKFDENVIKCLESKIRKMSESEKYCLICAGEVPLTKHLYYQINNDKLVGFQEINEIQEKEIATHAFVVMARGIFSNWKQPLAFCFLNQGSKNYSELNTWLENIMSKMIDIGFNVCAFTSDQDCNFINLAATKLVSTNQPFFFVNRRKIYYIFDVPHLIKSLRNCLIKYDFVYNDDDDGSEQVASWDDIEQMYNIEKNKRYKMSSKLTQSHISPNNFEKTCVKYATQILSRTAAVTIGTLVESGELPEKCIGTIKFIELMNDTFDILNSSKMSNDYKCKNAYHRAEYQTNTLEKAVRVLSGLRIINHNNSKDVMNPLKFINGFLISIIAISNLASDLKHEDYDYLFTRRLNQDPLEFFFGKVKKQVVKCREPTAIQFLTTFKKLCVNNILKHVKNTDCAEDLDKLFMGVDKTQRSLKTRQNIVMESLERTLKVGTVDYRFDLPEQNAFTCVCEYLLKKCYDHHTDCEFMKDYIKINEHVDENNTVALINTPKDFIEYIKEINSICEDHFINNNFHNIGSEIMRKISATVFNLPCPCFPLEYLKKLFVRFRIFNVIRHNNKKFRDKSVKRKHFSVSHL